LLKKIILVLVNKAILIITILFAINVMILAKIVMVISKIALIAMQNNIEL
jgi:hypothetical protein